MKCYYSGFYLLLCSSFNLHPFCQILDSSKLNEFADNNLKVDENGRKLFKWLENIEGKGEIALYEQPHLGGSVVSLSDSRPGGREFDPRLRRLFFPACFHLSPLQKHVRKVVGGFGKISCVSTGVRKPGNTCASPTAMI